MKRLWQAGSFITIVAALSVAVAALDAQVQTVEAPRFEVDPLWPKPLPNGWVLGNVIGVGVDSRDHVYIIHRQESVTGIENAAGVEPKQAECCSAAPPVLEFDGDGNLIKAWGGPAEGYVWPQSNHGIAIDDKDNVWIGGNGTRDSHILKFTRTGQYLATYGTPNVGTTPNSNATDRFGRVAKVSFDLQSREAFVADGYSNRRVAVLDMETGAFKRYWGAYGNKPDDTQTPAYNPDAPLIQQFRTPVHCAEPSSDGFVYVCDRPNNRIQVFRKDGTFVREKQYMPRTLGDGAVWDIAFSRDAQQRFMYLADGKNERVYVIDRNSMEILTMFGDGGRQPGQFFAVHSIATDSRGNIYTTETYEGKRVQKFVYRGMGRVPRNQGVLWPTGGGQ